MEGNPILGIISIPFTIEKDILADF